MSPVPPAPHRPRSCPAAEGSAVDISRIRKTTGAVLSSIEQPAPLPSPVSALLLRDARNNVKLRVKWVSAHRSCPPRRSFSQSSASAAAANSCSSGFTPPSCLLGPPREVVGFGHFFKQACFDSRNQNQFCKRPRRKDSKQDGRRGAGRLDRRRCGLGR